MTSKAEYLKKHYGSVSAAAPGSAEPGGAVRKKKRTKQDGGKKAGKKRHLTVAVHDDDEAADSWKAAGDASDSEEDAVPVVDTVSSGFRARADSSWQPIRGADPTSDGGLAAVSSEAAAQTSSPPPKSRPRGSSPQSEDGAHESKRRRRQGARPPGLHADTEPASPSRSPSRRRQPLSRSSSPSRRRQPRSRSRSRSASAERMTSGVRVGLQRAQDVDRDMQRFRESRMASFKDLADDVTGRGAATVYRDKTGRKIDIAQQQLLEKEERRRKEEEEARNMEWGKGLVQRREAILEKQALEKQKAMPLSIYKDNPELNEKLKQRERWNDPAAPFLTQRSSTKEPKYPKYQGPAPPPNRFGIAPGYRWDGVDRSNGFERELLARQPSRKAMEAQAYAWSVEDM